jgi:hypothetical protein
LTATTNDDGECDDRQQHSFIHSFIHPSCGLVLVGTTSQRKLWAATAVAVVVVEEEEEEEEEEASA